MKISRREFLGTFATAPFAYGAWQLPVVLELFEELPTVRGEMNPLLCSTQDIVDRKTNYMVYWNPHETRPPETDRYLAEHLFRLPLPAGKILEVGTYKCESFDQICDFYGQDRCLGVEVFPYARRPNVIAKDVRDVSPSDWGNEPLAFGWSDVSSWKHSPQSRLASAQLINQKLVVGGYLVESSLDLIPQNIRFVGYRPVRSFGESLILQKVSNRATILQVA